MLFDIAPSEMLLTVIVAVVVIGPKDLPMALRTAGRWLGKMRRVSGHFRTGIETMIREAELEDMEKKWREQNETIMKAHPSAETPLTPSLIEHAPPGDALAAAPHAVDDEPQPPLPAVAAPAPRAAEDGVPEQSGAHPGPHPTAPSAD
jgi:sec-independent protein translocase protein TatB